VVFVAIIAATFVAALRNAVAGRDTHGIGSAALLGAWCGLIVSGLFVDTLHWRHLWLVAALVWAASLRSRAGVHSTTRSALGAPHRGLAVTRRHGALTGARSRTRRLVTVGLALAALIVVVPSLLSNTVLSSAEPVPAGGPVEAGTVHFVQYADSAFDQFVQTSRHASFLNAKYSRMRTYSPFFDERLSWYRNAWVYQDLQAIYPGTDWARRHPEWILRDRAGRRLYVPWGCKDGTCPQYAADIGDPRFRNAWLRAAAEKLDHGYRGLFVDDVNLTPQVGDGSGRRVMPVDDRTGRRMTDADWKRYMAEFTEAIRRRFPGVEIVHNALWGVGDDDPFIRRQLAAADVINLERGVTDAGIRGGTGQWGLQTLFAYIDRIHANGGRVVFESKAESDLAREYALAAYFLMSQGSDGIGNLQGGTPDDWWYGWDVRLGAPAGARTEWQGLIRRDFELGAVLLNEPDAPLRVVDVGDGYVRMDGTPVRTVELGPAQGIVLLRASAPE
jgi:hypothetical protein